VATAKATHLQARERFESMGVSARTVQEGVDPGVTGILQNGDRLRMSGLGIIEMKDRPARMGRNPVTGAPVQIAAGKKVAFRAST
jgi:DNA-binding protein HU-beta